MSKCLLASADWRIPLRRNTSVNRGWHSSGADCVAHVGQNWLLASFAASAWSFAICALRHAARVRSRPGTDHQRLQASRGVENGEQWHAVNTAAIGTCDLEVTRAVPPCFQRALHGRSPACGARSSPRPRRILTVWRNQLLLWHPEHLWSVDCWRARCCLDGPARPGLRSACRRRPARVAAPRATDRAHATCRRRYR